MSAMPISAASFVIINVPDGENAKPSGCLNIAGSSSQAALGSPWGSVITSNLSVAETI